MTKRPLFLMLLVVVSLASMAKETPERASINLAGEWLLELDGMGNSDDVVTLPGTTDTNRKGKACDNKTETTHLTRLYSFVGKAWYTKTVVIPKDWKKKDISLYLERTKPTTLYIDGDSVGHCDNISTPQVYNLSDKLTPGTHDIKILVDNSTTSVPPQLITSSHAYTEDTQTNWNGIIGRIELIAKNVTNIADLQVYTDVDKYELKAVVTLSQPLAKKTNVYINAGDGNGHTFVAEKGATTIEKTIAIDKDKVKTWSEFHSDTYDLAVELMGYDKVATRYAMRKFEARGHHFYVNGHKTFLRGKHDACVFPLTAHVAMDKTSWRNYLATCKRYGINHIRFHSWCPPEECFAVADEMGIYLQPELPFWGDFKKEDPRLLPYLKKEGENILRTYGNHPSFVMFGLGNELWGDIPSMANFVEDFRKQDSRHLYTFGSNMYLGYQGLLDGMDYFTTCRNGGEMPGLAYNTHTRGSFSYADAEDGGYINNRYPNSTMTFDEAVNNCAAPIISHETGQFQTYPDYGEIKKYTGVLYPYNLEVFRSRLEKAGMADQATDFHQASGKWSVQLYKADMEMDMRTRNMAGYQLLDLQDYPGQGTALVGVLDAFMDSKGITTPEEWNQWCAPVVPMLIVPKFCYTNNEELRGDIDIVNYGEQSLKGKDVEWSLQRWNGEEIAFGSFPVCEDSVGRFNGEHIFAKLSMITKAEELTFHIKIRGTAYGNTYPLWVYPSETTELATLEKDIMIVDTLTAMTMKRLENGAKVLFMPRGTMLKEQTVGALFQTDYWNYRMFKTICENNKKPVSPGTLGLLVNDKHPLLADYPTSNHTSWQWFPVVKASRPMILDLMPKGYRPIVQVIDNVERNHRLGLIFEMGVGKGKMIVCMSPLKKLLDYPEAKQLYTSTLEYMQSNEFSPSTSITPEELNSLMTTVTDNNKIGELRNISFE